MIMVDLEGTLSDHSARLKILLANEEKYKGRDREAWKTYYKGLLEPHQTKIKGPDLVVQWVRQYDPAIVVDDRDEVRDKIRELHRGIMAYSPNAFLKIEGESDEHPLRK